MIETTWAFVLHLGLNPPVQPSPLVLLVVWQHILVGDDCRLVGAVEEDPEAASLVQRRLDARRPPRPAADVGEHALGAEAGLDGRRHGNC